MSLLAALGMIAIGLAGPDHRFRARSGLRRRARGPDRGGGAGRGRARGRSRDHRHPRPRSPSRPLRAGLGMQGLRHNGLRRGHQARPARRLPPRRIANPGARSRRRSSPGRAAALAAALAGLDAPAAAAGGADDHLGTQARCPTGPRPRPGSPPPRPARASPPLWLDLREPADHAARDPAPARRGVGRLSVPASRSISAAAPGRWPARAAAARWRCSTTSDPDLRIAATRLPGAALVRATSPTRRPSTASASSPPSALLDHMPGAWIEQRPTAAAARVAAYACPLPASLPARPRSPPLAEDAPRSCAPSSRHQRRDKGLGLALGPGPAPPSPPALAAPARRPHRLRPTAPRPRRSRSGRAGRGHRRAATGSRSSAAGWAGPRLRRDRLRHGRPSRHARAAQHAVEDHVAPQPIDMRLRPQRVGPAAGSPPSAARRPRPR